MNKIEKKLPRSIMRSMKPYLFSRERLLDFIKEVWAPGNTSWLILTNKRIIVVTRTSFELKFVDYGIWGLDLNLTLGLPFDTIDLEVTGKKYTGHFYWVNRKKTLNFLEKMERKVDAKNREDRKEKDNIDAIKQLKELAELKKQGIISEEEFEKKKKKILRKI